MVLYPVLGAMGSTFGIAFLGLLLASLVLQCESLCSSQLVIKPCCSRKSSCTPKQVPAVAASCPVDWTAYKGFCYSLFNNQLSWADAEIDCHKLGAQLASIHFMEDMVHISHYIKKFIQGNGNVWIGMHSPQNDRRWQWVDQTSVRYMPWNDGEPNNFLFNEGCVELLSKKDYIRWNDKKCSTRQGYLCKMIAV